MSKVRIRRDPSKPSQRAIALGLDALCCILLSIGVILAFDQLFRFRAGTAAILWHPVVITALLVLLTRRWWILPAVVAGVGGIGCLIMAMTDTLQPFLTFAEGIAHWWITLFPSRSIYNTPENILLVQWIIHLFITCLMFLCVRRVHAVSVLAVAAGLLFLIIHANGFRENIVPIVLILIGMLSLLGRNLRVRGELLSPRWRLQVASIALCTACSVLAVALLPADTAGWKTPPFTSIAADFQSLLGLNNKSLDNFEPLTLQSAGLQPQQSRLGGDIELNSAAPVLAVRTDTPMLFKGRVYDTYTGKGWETTAVNSYRLQSGLFEEERRAAFDIGKPAGESAQALLERASYPAEAQVNLLRGGSSLFAYGRIRGAERLAGGNDPILFNRHSEIFVHGVLAAQYQYRFSTLFIDRTHDETLLALETAALQTEDPDYAAVRQQYLQLPDELPPSIGQLAASATAGAATPYQQMSKLESYLRSRYRYTLTPGPVPHGEDFVAYFLSSGQGYCVYFASAMSVMARTLDIPARFVVGYGLESVGGTSWVARERNAHAWVECYFRGLGWVAFDPTAGSNYRDPPRAVKPPEQDPGQDPSDMSEWVDPSNAIPTFGEPTLFGHASTVTTAPSTQAVTTPGQTATSIQPPAGDPPSFHLPGWAFWLALSVVCLCLCLLYLLRRIRRNRAAYRLETIRSRFPDAAGQAGAYYADILNQLQLLGYTYAPGETMQHFAQRVAPDLPGDVDPAVCAAFDIVMQWRYGDQQPQAADIAHMAAVHDRLEALLKATLKKGRYAVRRLVIGHRDV